MLARHPEPELTLLPRCVSQKKERGAQKTSAQLSTGGEEPGTAWSLS